MLLITTKDGKENGTELRFQGKNGVKMCKCMEMISASFFLGVIPQADSWELLFIYIWSNVFLTRFSRHNPKCLIAPTPTRTKSLS